MSNLILTRKPGQSVDLFDNSTGRSLTLNLISAVNGRAMIHFDGGPAFTLHLGQNAPAPSMDLSVALIAMQGRCARLVFNAPRTIDIVRTELKRHASH